MNKVDSTTFRERLLWALEYANITRPEAQPIHVANAARVSLRTAKRYLAGETSPNLERAGALAAGLGVFVGWLWCGGDGPRTERELAFRQNAARMSHADRDKLCRVMFLYQNGSKRVRRLAALMDVGQISPRTFLDIASAPSAGSRS